MMPEQHSSGKGTRGDAKADVATPPTAFSHLVSPLRVGTMELRNRLMVPPHGARIGNLWGTDEEAAKNIAYWEVRAQAGAAWIGGVTGFLGNVLIPGFEPTGGGVRSALAGHFRQPFFVDRIGMFADRMHAAGGSFDRPDGDAGRGAARPFAGHERGDHQRGSSRAG